MRNKEAPLSIRIRYEGERDSLGYSQHLDDDPDSGGVCFAIIAREGPKVPVILDGGAPCLFEEFSKIDPSDPSDICDVCDQYGLPEPFNLESVSLESFRAWLSTLGAILKTAHGINPKDERHWLLLEREAKDLLSSAEWKKLERIEYKRVPGTKEPQLIAVTRNLFNFAVLQLFAAVADGQEIKKCGHAECRGYFSAGGSSGRKKDGVYCSTKCRVAAHREKA